MASRRLLLIWIVAATAVAFVAAGVLVLALGNDDSDADGNDDTASAAELNPAADVPDRVQDIVLVSLDDPPDRTLGELLGDRPMVLNFFASWCQPCLEEMPDFEEVYGEVGDQVDFVGMAYNDTADRALDMVEQTGVTFPTYADRNGSAITYFESLGMPTTVFLAPDGEVLEVKTGPLSADALRDRLQEHFEIEADD